MIETRYHYRATIKSTDVQLSDLPMELVNEVVFNSRKFASFDDCALSCKALMEGYAGKLNSAEEKFRIASEVNPIHSGQPTLSKDWGVNETARIWVYDKKMEGTGSISAVGQARIFSSSEYVSLQKPSLS